MGEFLSTPNKEKNSDEKENYFVIKYFIYNISSLDTERAVCKDGGSEWKTHTFAT